jgi:hypothetical protein
VLSDEVMTFKSLIVCHKLVQEGHPVVRVSPSPSRKIDVEREKLTFCLLLWTWPIRFAQTIKDAHHQTGWLETCGRTVNSDGGRGEQPRLYLISLSASC